MAFNPLNRKLDRNGNPIVSKKELEDSGMSLREFLNKERGLTPRMRTQDMEPPHIDAEAGMTRGTRRGAGAGRGFVNPEMPKTDTRDLEAGMSRGTRTFAPDTSEVDRVKNLMDASGVSLDRKDEAGNAYKKGGKVKSVAKGWGIARGARKAKMY